MSSTTHRIALGLILVGVTATPLAAQGRGNSRGGIPPGHMPPPGECRVWYDGRPPGQQPPPTSCREAERLAGRNGARVIYGDDRRDSRKNRDRNQDWERNRDRDRDDDRRDRNRRDDDVRGDRENRGRDTSGRAIPRTERYPDRFPTIPDVRRGRTTVNSTAAANGYRDGLAKGREDIRDGDSYDPNRHAWYRSADRGYRNTAGSREGYRSEYRDGFLRGYDEAYNGRRR